MKSIKSLARVGIYLFFAQNIFLALGVAVFLINIIFFASSYKPNVPFVLFAVCVVCGVLCVVGQNIIKGMIALKGVDIVPDNAKFGLYKFFSQILAKSEGE